MKQFFKSLWTVAALATVFAGCSKDEAESPANKPREISMSVIAGSELESSPASRTTLNDDNSISWETSGEFLRVFETAGTETNSRKSEEALIDAGKAVFNVSFTENTSATAFTYNAVYPESAWVTSSNSDVNRMKLITPTNQLPTATSFDGDADLLIAYPEQKDIQPTELQVRFKRIIAVGKMTIKNLNSSEVITSVEFIAPENKKVTGRSYVNLNEGVVTEYGYSSMHYSNVIMSYDASLNMQSGMTAYFTCFPFEILAGETFKVVVTTPSKIFTREVTIPEGGNSLAFKVGQSSTFSVNMATATEEVIETPEPGIEAGDYVIMAYYAKTDQYYAMSSTPSKNRLGYVNVTYDNSGEINPDDESIVWTFAQGTEGWTIANGADNYLKYADKGASTTSSEDYFSIEKQEDGTYIISANAATEYSLRLNCNDPNNTFFAFYKTGATATITDDILLVPVSGTPKTALDTPADLATEVDGNMVLVGWKPVAGATSYTVSFEPATIEPRTVLHDDAKAEYSELFEGLDYATEYTVSVVANPADTENYKASAPATATFTTGEDPNQTITPIGKITTEGNYTAEGTVVARGSQAYIIADNTGAMMVYHNGNERAVGEKISISGAVELYSNANGSSKSTPQFTNTATVKVLSTDNVWTYNPTAMDGTAMDALLSGELVCQEVQFEGNLEIRGNYMNVTIPGASTAIGSIKYVETSTVEAYNGKDIIVKGYYVGYSSNMYVNVLPYSVEEANPSTDPAIKADPTSLSFAAAGESKEVTYTAENLGSNQVFAAVSGENASQFSVTTVSNGTVTVTALENTETTAKTATLTLYIAASEGGEHLDEAIVALTQAGVSSGESITYIETFSNFTETTNKYNGNGSYSSTEIAGLSWTYANCQLNQNGSKFILGKNTANASLTSSNISDGVSEITINWNAPFSSDKLRMLVYVNDNLVGTLDITATSGASGQETISGINVSGNAVIKITGAAKVGSKDNRPGITGISWKNNN